MIPARSHRLRNRTLALVDRFHAEPVKLSFLDKNGKTDPDRPMREIEAILQVGAGKDATVSGGVDRAWHGRASAQPAALHIDRARYQNLIIRKGDKVQALARSGQPWFEIVAVDDRGEPRLVVHLGEA